MKFLLIGKQGSGKTTTLLRTLNKMKKPIVFFSELPKSGIEQFALANGVDISDVKIIEPRPTTEIIMAFSNDYNTVLIDHWRRIKNVDVKKYRNEFYDFLEKSDKDFWILAHTLKGAEATDLSNGRWISGLDSVVDVAYGLINFGDERIYKILKDRYYIHKGKKYVLEGGLG